MAPTHGLWHVPRTRILLLTLIPDPTSPYTSSIAIPSCWTPCANRFSGVEAIPGVGCRMYQVCFEGEVKNRVSCGSDLLYNPIAEYCDYEWNFNCNLEPTCSPTFSPSDSPTESPSVSPTTLRPTRSPSKSPTKPPTRSPSTSPTESPSASPTTGPTTPPTDRPTDSPTLTPTYYPTNSEFASPIIRKSRPLLEKYVFISYTSAGLTYPSLKYTYDKFYDALQIMANGFGANFQFFLGDADTDQFVYGLVNVAAFLANAMVEAIQYDTCDELNMQAVAGRYAISNSCGQEGRSYQDEECDEKYSCTVDKSMKITAVDSGKGVRAPPPFQCQPGSGPGFYSGYWDTSTGVEIVDTPYSSSAGRTDTEGCCWWGRGALLTKNVCNIGKVNYYLGSRAAMDGRPALYPNTNFCTYPEATCSSNFSEEMRWTVAMFEWAERIQRYNSAKWSYDAELIKFVDGGMTDDSFIMSVGRVLTNGCHAKDCSTIDVLMADRRKENFYLIINDIFNVKVLNTKKPTRQPIQKATLVQEVNSPTTSTIGGPVSSTELEQPEYYPPNTSPSYYANEETTDRPTLTSLLIKLDQNSSVMKGSSVYSQGAKMIFILFASLFWML